jgi:ABC-type nickel/cobalt efflux system permease component RcnA
MRRSLIALVLALCALPLGGFRSSAHPLGNFTVNHLSRVTVAADAIRVRYVLDLAEIPTLQETQAGRVVGIAQRLARELVLQMDGAPILLALRSSSVEELPGQAGLATLRVTLDLDGRGARDGARLTYRDATYAGRIGWHAVVLDGGVRDASVAAEDPTNELRAYPTDSTLTPPDVTEAAAVVDLKVIVSRGSVSEAAASRFAVDASADALTALLRSGDTDLGALAAALLVAMILGAIHAFGPGHGKAMVAAYLVGSRGTPAQAVILGTTVTVTHTAGVYLLGAVTLVAAQYVLPERLYPILGVASGILVVAIGLGLLRSRVAALRTRSHDGTHHHAHDHDHGDGPDRHQHTARVGLRGLLALGISGGLLPCPTALVVLLAAVSFHNVALGMILVAAFSIGLAAVLTGIGLALVFGQRAIASRGTLAHLAGSAAARAIPIVSAAAVTVAGILIAVGAARGFA